MFPPLSYSYCNLMYLFNKLWQHLVRFSIVSKKKKQKKLVTPTSDIWPLQYRPPTLCQPTADEYKSQEKKKNTNKKSCQPHCVNYHESASTFFLWALNTSFFSFFLFFVKAIEKADRFKTHQSAYKRPVFTIPRLEVTFTGRLGSDDRVMISEKLKKKKKRDKFLRHHCYYTS